MTAIYAPSDTQRLPLGDHTILRDIIREKISRSQVGRNGTILRHSSNMTEQELNRAIQYVTATTSYGRETVAEILTTGLSELSSLSGQSPAAFEREPLLEYVCQWTMKCTGHPEPLVREVLGSAGRWLDEVVEQLAKQDRKRSNVLSDDDEGAEPA
jgi:hypothetical protein